MLSSERTSVPNELEAPTVMAEGSLPGVNPTVNLSAVAILAVVAGRRDHHDAASTNLRTVLHTGHQCRIMAAMPRLMLRRECCGSDDESAPNRGRPNARNRARTFGVGTRRLMILALRATPE